MEVRILRHIREIAPGTYYTGHLRIEDNVFDYQLEFATPIPSLNSVTSNPRNSIRWFCTLTLSQEGRIINLDDGEYTLFMGFLLDFTVGFYKELHGESPEGSVNRTTSVKLSEWATRTLLHPKFGFVTT